VDGLELAKLGQGKCNTDKDCEEFNKDQPQVKVECINKDYCEITYEDGEKMKGRPGAHK